jgi:hypothetical protein|tara:strand:- start:219 stop:476 length:258 start_codon:yes stop_codon:yes gene_type:complete
MKEDSKDLTEKAPYGITRKEALQKMGKYAAFTVMGTFVILNPKKAQAQSADPVDPDPVLDDPGADDPGTDDPGGATPPTPPGWGG